MLNCGPSQIKIWICTEETHLFNYFRLETVLHTVQVINILKQNDKIYTTLDSEKEHLWSSELLNVTAPGLNELLLLSYYDDTWKLACHAGLWNILVLKITCYSLMIHKLNFFKI